MTLDILATLGLSDGILFEYKDQAESEVFYKERICEVRVVDKQYDEYHEKELRQSVGMAIGQSIGGVLGAAVGMKVGEDAYENMERETYEKETCEIRNQRDVVVNEYCRVGIRYNGKELKGEVPKCTGDFDYIVKELGL